MDHNSQARNPVYDNVVFQPQEPGPAPYSPTDAFVVIKTHHSTTPAGPCPKKKEKRVSTKRIIITVSGCGVVILVAVGVLLWYFLGFQRVQSKAGPRGIIGSQWCDGFPGCHYGENESYSFRLHGKNSVLQSYSSQSQDWLPVCADGWNDDYGKAACGEIGYDRQDYVRSNQISVDMFSSKGYMKLQHGSTSAYELQSYLAVSHFCYSGAVTLQCIECGVSSPSSRIMGGTEAFFGTWPWQVSLQALEYHQCGGAIISRTWILTAAHCFLTLPNPQFWSAHSGEVRLSQMNRGMSIRRIIVHPAFESRTNNNDIALVELVEPLTFTPNVKAACIPNAGVNITPGSEAWISGWGTAKPFGVLGGTPDILNEGKVTIYSRETCNREEILNGSVKESMICAGNMEGGVDSCKGDSGGPLMVKTGNRWWMAGHTSWGIGCALKNKPGVYGNVTYFNEWIYMTMKSWKKDT